MIWQKVIWWEASIGKKGEILLKKIKVKIINLIFKDKEVWAGKKFPKFMKKVKKKKIVEKVVKVILEVKNKLNKEANQGKNPIKYLKVLIHRV